MKNMNNQELLDSVENEILKHKENYSENQIKELIEIFNEIINVKAKSVKRICLNSLNKEGGIKEDDVIKFKFHNNVSRFGLLGKNIKEIKI